LAFSAGAKPRKPSSTVPPFSGGGVNIRARCSAAAAFASLTSAEPRKPIAVVPIRTTAAAAISGRRQVAPEEVEMEIIKKDPLSKGVDLS
jgi:hypothetical protein